MTVMRLLCLAVIGGTPAGNDHLSGGPGNDVLSGGSGNDTIDVRNHRRDRVNRGAGRDVATADRIDVLRGCEQVHRT